MIACRGRGNLPLKLDLHVHSSYSYDSLITPEELVFYAKKRGLDGVAITDHGRIDGAQRIAKKTDFFIIPGIEIESSEGHIVGLDIKQPIPRKLSADETVDRIHEAGGVAIACHPVTLLKISLGRRTSSKFDAVEVINSSAIPFSYSVKRGQELASRLGLGRVAGSDAHYGPEIGYAYTVVDSELRADCISNAIKRGMCQPFGKAIPLTMKLKKMLLMVGKRDLKS
jgi:predicted metal-dependent phosphoesterase TrpH